MNTDDPSDGQRRELVRWLLQRSAPPRNARRAPRRSSRLRGAAEAHRDVEFAVDDTRGEEHIFKTFDEALAFAAPMALRSGVRIEIDVLAYSREGAVWWSGIDGGQDYDEDPEASVFDRLHLKITSQGRVP